MYSPCYTPEINFEAVVSVLLDGAPAVLQIPEQSTPIRAIYYIDTKPNHTKPNHWAAASDEQMGREENRRIFHAFFLKKDRKKSFKSKLCLNGLLPE